MIKHPDQRVGVFIDVQNMYYSARNIFGAKVNFGEVVRRSVENRQLIRAIAYVVRTKTGEEKPFFEALYHQGIEYKEKEIQEFFGGAKKADWDVGMAVDAIRISANLDVVIIVSGDGDFVPLVEYLRNQGRQVEVVSFRESSSTKLVESADVYTDLSGEPDVYLIRDARSARRGSAEKAPAADADTSVGIPTSRRREEPAPSDDAADGGPVIIRGGKKIPI